MSKERYTNEAIKSSVTTPCANMKVSVSRKDKPNESFLDENAKVLISGIISSYPENYAYLRNSIYYDVKAHPLNHFRAFIKLGELLQSLTFNEEKNTSKSFVVYPLRTSFIPEHITVDTLMMNHHILGAKKHNDQKPVVWNRVLLMNYRALKNQIVNKSVCFKGTLLTDGVSVSLVKQNFEPGRSKKPTMKPKPDKAIDGEEEFSYIDNFTKEQLKEFEGRCVLIDPRRRDILYCMKESSTLYDKKLFRFTKNKRTKKARRLKYLRNILKPECIKSAELELSRFPSTVLNVEKFVQFLKARKQVALQLLEYYGNETLTEAPSYQSNPLDFAVKEKGDIYYGKYLLFIKRIDDAPPGIANLQSYIKYLTLLTSIEHLKKRLTTADINCLKAIIENASIWLDSVNHTEDELEVKKAL